MERQLENRLDEAGHDTLLLSLLKEEVFVSLLLCWWLGKGLEDSE